MAHLITKYIVSSWWVFFFALFTFGVYEQASHSIVKAIHKLEGKVATLEEEIRKEKEKEEDYKLQIASFSDPAFQEFVLMKGLGVIPEGYRKIYFETSQKKGCEG